MNFRKSFEKTAVSGEWATKRMLGGLATRAGYSVGSGAHNKATALSSKLLRGKNLTSKDPGLKNQIRRAANKTEFSRDNASANLMHFKDMVSK